MVVGVERGSGPASAVVGDAAEGGSDVVTDADGRRQVGDVLRVGVLGADAARVDAVGLAGLGEGVVAAVEVLALLEVLGQVVASAGDLAVQAEEALLLGGEGLDVGWMVSVVILRISKRQE